MADLGEAYGFEMTADDGAMAAGDYVSKRLQGSPEIGDRVSIGNVELIVRELSDDAEIAGIGLAVEPSRAARPKLPLFQTRDELIDLLRKSRARWRLWRGKRRANRATKAALRRVGDDEAAGP